jgi:hypothetical protein
LAETTNTTLAVSTHTSPRWNRALAWLIAALLLFAAGAKGYQAMHMRTSALLLPESAFEAALALWLASGFQRIWARRLSMGAFAIFAIVSLVKIHHGAVSCGCFGAIRVSPIAMFRVDTALVAVLILSGMKVQREKISASRPSSGRSFFDTAIFRASLAAIVVIAAAISLRITRLVPVPHIATIAATEPTGPKPDAAGVKIGKTEWLADTGDIAGGQIIRAIFTVENPSNRPLAIADVVPGCHCTSVPDPPEVIPASGSVTLEVDVDVSEEPGEFEQTVELNTQDRQFPMLLLRIAGNVVVKQ